MSFVVTPRKTRKQRIPLALKKYGWLTYQIQEFFDINRNCLSTVVGATGSGKSSLALYFSEALSKFPGNAPFSVENTVYDVRDFFTLVEELPSRSSIVIDEAAVSYDNRSWQNLTNKMFGYVLASFRWRLINVFFCIPDFEQVDKNTRRLAHVLIRMFRPGQARVKKLKSNYEDKRWSKTVGFLTDVPYPSKPLWEAYNKRKERYFKRLNVNIRERMKGRKTLYSKPEVFRNETNMEVIEDAEEKI